MRAVVIDGFGELLADKAVTRPETEVVRLRSAAEMLRRIDVGHVRGKLMLAVAPERM